MLAFNFNTALKYHVGQRPFLYVLDFIDARTSKYFAKKSPPVGTETYFLYFQIIVDDFANSNCVLLKKEHNLFYYCT